MTHQCPGTGCTKQVPDRMLACGPHWYRVTLATRSRVWRAYLAYGIGSDEHTEAITQAITEMNRERFRRMR